MWKFKVFLRFDKEEAWLEKMAKTGWLLSEKGLFYHFKRTSPEEKKIRIDYRIFRSRQDFNEYCTLFADSGWRHLAGTKTSGIQYFLKDSAKSSEDIFSDQLSQAGRYRRAGGMCLCTAVSFAALWISMLSSETVMGIDTLFAPKQWYFTPGLWEMEGVDFWWSFLFETPFALMRGLGWSLPALAILLYGIYGCRAYLFYRAAVREQENTKSIL